MRLIGLFTIMVLLSFNIYSKTRVFVKDGTLVGGVYSEEEITNLKLQWDEVVDNKYLDKMTNLWSSEKLYIIFDTKLKTSYDYVLLDETEVDSILVRMQCPEVKVETDTNATANCDSKIEYVTQVKIKYKTKSSLFGSWFVSTAIFVTGVVVGGLTYKYFISDL